MDLFDVVRACLRRWYVVLPLMLISAWVAYHSYSSVKPEYYSNAVVGIAPPNSQVQFSPDGLPVPRNGLLETGGVSLIMNMAVLGYGDPAIRAQVVEAGGKSDFIVKMFPTPVGSTQPELPLIMIEAAESDPTSAAKTVQAAADQADLVLRNLQQQAGVPVDQMAHALSASPPSMPVAVTPSRTKSAAFLFLAGAAIAILIGVLVDVIMMRRRTRRQLPSKNTKATDVGENPQNDRPQHQEATAEMAIDRR